MTLKWEMSHEWVAHFDLGERNCFPCFASCSMSGQCLWACHVTSQAIFIWGTEFSVPLHATLHFTWVHLQPFLLTDALWTRHFHMSAATISVWCICTGLQFPPFLCIFHRFKPHELMLSSLLPAPLCGSHFWIFIYVMWSALIVVSTKKWFSLFWPSESKNTMKSTMLPSILGEVSPMAACKIIMGINATCWTMGSIKTIACQKVTLQSLRFQGCVLFALFSCCIGPPKGLRCKIIWQTSGGCVWDTGERKGRHSFQILSFDAVLAGWSWKLRPCVKGGGQQMHPSWTWQLNLLLILGSLMASNKHNLLGAHFCSLCMSHCFCSMAGVLSVDWHWKMTKTILPLPINSTS